jgi:anti-sigma regulatory factor (Ser/Thr protein kinase)
MVICPDDVDAILRAIRDNDIDAISAVHIDGFKLGAAFELACARYVGNDNYSSEALKIIDMWRIADIFLNKALSSLEKPLENAKHSDIFAAPEWEIYPAPSEQDVVNSGTQWNLFLQRFERSLKENGGFNSSLALALARVLGEMADNIIEHSSQQGVAPARGIVGYRVDAGRMTLAVADVGRGVLNSLKENPENADIENSSDALTQAVCHGASRRIGMGNGGGFNQVHESLADRHGELRFRSADMALTLNGRGKNREKSLDFSPFLAGFQLCVSCAIDSAEIKDSL